MRVISQNGAIDVLYEMTAFHLVGGMIHMNMVGDTGKGTLIAQYEMPEKAKKAMEMLRESYDSIEFMKCCHPEETFSTMRNILSSEDFDKATSSCFKFPADDEIEVEE